MRVSVQDDIENRVKIRRFMGVISSLSEASNLQKTPISSK